MTLTWKTAELPKCRLCLEGVQSVVCGESGTWLQINARASHCLNPVTPRDQEILPLEGTSYTFSPPTLGALFSPMVFLAGLLVPLP